MTTWIMAAGLVMLIAVLVTEWLERRKWQRNEVPAQPANNLTATYANDSYHPPADGGWIGLADPPNIVPATPLINEVVLNRAAGLDYLHSELSHGRRLGLATARVMLNAYCNSQYTYHEVYEMLRDDSRFVNNGKGWKRAVVRPITGSLEEVETCETCTDPEVYPGRVYNNSDVTSGQWVECPDCAERQAAE